jgi:hypothetical protein
MRTPTKKPLTHQKRIQSAIQLILFGECAEDGTMARRRHGGEDETNRQIVS